MNVFIHPSKVTGTVIAPPSKSYTHRAIIVASLARGSSIIKNVLLSDDTLYTLAACKALGTSIRIRGTTVTIDGFDGQPHAPKDKRPIFCGASGTTARLIASVAALCPDWVMIDGDSRLRQRPMKTLLDALASWNAQIEYAKDEGYLPLRIKSSELTGGKLAVSARVSSQFISSLLIVAPYAQQDTYIYMKGNRSVPYIDITLDIMKTFGVRAARRPLAKLQENTLHVGYNQKYQAREYTVEGDYSSASYFFAAAAVTGSSVTVEGLDPDSAQGDKAMLSILEEMGCSVKRSNWSATVIGKELNGITRDMGNIPDIVPTVAAVAPYAKTPTRITNIGHLRQKETDRIEAVAKELRKMKAEVETTDDSITVFPSQLHGAAINTYNDHRIAMSFAVAALGALEPVFIRDSDVISKSYPDFWEDFRKIGAKVQFMP